MTENLLRATVTQRGVCFAPDETVLLLQRAWDGRWELPGGRVGTSESALARLRREIVEETGLIPQIITPVHTLTWQNDEEEGALPSLLLPTLRPVGDALSGAYWLKSGRSFRSRSTAERCPDDCVEKAVDIHQQKRQ